MNNKLVHLPLTKMPKWYKRKEETNSLENIETPK